MQFSGINVTCSSKNALFRFAISIEETSTSPSFPLDVLMRESHKIVPVILSKLLLNKKIYARSCVVKKTDKKMAELFLNNYHIMNATKSVTNLGLFYKDELVALASFSSGRKMNRLPAHKRSFELIRFCSLPGITVTGGLSKLLKFFATETKAGDIMTYVDPQLSDGSAFLKAGFTFHSVTSPHFFLINKISFERISHKEGDTQYDKTKFYLFSDAGNIKLVYKPAITAEPLS